MVTFACYHRNITIKEGKKIGGDTEKGLRVHDLKTVCATRKDPHTQFASADMNRATTDTGHAKNLWLMAADLL